MKLAIIGSRGCPKLEVERFLTRIPDTVVSGGAVGADSNARDFAKRNGLKLIEYYPDYARYGRTAPLERNKLIVDECDCLLAFWDGESRGTKFTIDYAREKNKPVKVILLQTLTP